MKFRKYFIVIAFVAIIFLPASIFAIEKYTDLEIDTTLGGYTDEVSRPELTVSSFLSGEFQSGFGSWLDSKIGLHGAMTRTYNSIQYEVFSIGNRPVGKSHYIFSSQYLWAEFCTSSEYDFSIEENRAAMENYANELLEVSNKLESCGKHLYVYITPSKADFNPEMAPANFNAMRNQDAVNGCDLFISYLNERDINYFYTADLKDSLQYPAFYPTGTHWSRTFEQVSTNHVINDLSSLTGNNYRSFNFNEAAVSNSPFFRDADVYELLNVWRRPRGTYYQYEINRVIPENYDRLHALMYADSFGEGLLLDIYSAYPDDSIYYVNYDNFILNYQNQILLNHDFNNMDWQTYLDNSDVVIIEMTEPNIQEYSHGFVSALNSFLDTYVPGEPSVYAVNNLDVINGEYDYDLINGVYVAEDYFSWTDRSLAVTLENPDITNNGITFDFEIPSEVFENADTDTIEVYINGTKVAESTYNSAGNYTIEISPDSFEPDSNNRYVVYVYCSGSFDIAKCDMSEYSITFASRLSTFGLKLTYIGARR